VKKGVREDTDPEMEEESPEFNNRGAACEEIIGMSNHYKGLGRKKWSPRPLRGKTRNKGRFRSLRKQNQGRNSEVGDTSRVVYSTGRGRKRFFRGLEGSMLEHEDELLRGKKGCQRVCSRGIKVGNSALVTGEGTVGGLCSPTI